MLIKRMYLPIKCECVALIFQIFSLSLFTERRKETKIKKAHSRSHTPKNAAPTVAKQCYIIADRCMQTKSMHFYLNR